MDLQQAKQTWESYWQGQINLEDIFQAHVNEVCMVAPERMDCLPTWGNAKGRAKANAMGKAKGMSSHLI